MDETRSIAVENEVHYSLEETTAPIAEIVAYLGAMIALSAVLLGLALWVHDNPVSGFDVKGVQVISGWDFSGASAIFNTIAFLTDNYPAFVIGIVSVAYVMKTGRSRIAIGLLASGLVVGAAAFFGDYVLGEYVGRPRPDGGHASFPSGHALGTIVFYGFAIYLALRYRLRSSLLVPIVLTSILLISTAGLSRIFQLAHWPTDVVGGYVLGLIALLALICFHRWYESIRWFAAPKLGVDVPVVPVKGVRVAGSYASVVMLDPEMGTATKFYSPPLVIRIIYWMAFQAKFPYDANPHALEASKYRRQIAGLLTEYRFGKNFVSPILSTGCISGRPSIISKYVDGQEAPNDKSAQNFLKDVSVLFAAAGMPIWQLNPRNPHSHTNLIRRPNGDHYIVDLESAIVTPIPAKGQIMSSLRRGSFPVFDDIDFLRLRAFVSIHEAELSARLGEKKLEELNSAISQGEMAFNSWHGSELRLASRFIRFTYALLNWKDMFSKARAVITEADTKGEVFLSKGLDKWVEEGRISLAEADALKLELKSEEIHDAMKNLGVHVAISATLRFPFGSIVRPLWTLSIWFRELYRYARTGSKACLAFIKVHNPLVVLLSIIPGFGAFAYLVSKPLRRVVLIRLMLDQIGRKVPFGLFAKLGFQRLIAPQKRQEPR